MQGASVGLWRVLSAVCTKAQCGGRSVRASYGLLSFARLRQRVGIGVRVLHLLRLAGAFGIFLCAADAVRVRLAD